MSEKLETELKDVAGGFTGGVNDEPATNDRGDKQLKGAEHKKQSAAGSLMSQPDFDANPKAYKAAANAEAELAKIKRQRERRNPARENLDGWDFSNETVEY